MVDGHFVMRNNKVLTMDEAALIAEADKVGKRVWKKVLESSGHVTLLPEGGRNDLLTQLQVSPLASPARPPPVPVPRRGHGSGHGHE